MNSVIGVSNESSLHKTLKYRYSGEDGDTETMIGDFICDGRTGTGEIIEVQTGSFGPLKKKIIALSAQNKIRIVHPVIISRYIETWDDENVFLRKRKSGKKGSAWDLFYNLIYAPELPKIPNLSLELTLIDIVEKRIADGTGPWRRRGSRIADKSVAAWHGSIVLKSLKDYFQFVPFKKNESFTVKKLAEKTGISPLLAGKCLYVLCRLNLVKKVGKEVNAYVYRRVGLRGRKSIL